MEGFLSTARQNLKQWNTKIKKEDKSDEIAERVYSLIKKNVLELTKREGVTSFTYNPNDVPVKVDEMMKQEGFIVWRNSEVVKYAIPTEED